MLLTIRKESKSTTKGPNYVIPKDQVSNDTPTSVTLLNPQQNEMLKTAKISKTPRKKRNLRGKQNKLQKIVANCESRFTSQSSNKLTTSLTTPALGLLSTSVSLLSSSTPSLKITKPNKRRTWPKQKSMWRLFFLPISLLLLVHSQNVINALEQSRHSTTTIATTKYSQPFEAEGNDEHGFRPIIPKDMNLEYISQNVFTKDGQYRVFEPVESDLRATVASRRADDVNVDVIAPLSLKSKPAEQIKTPQTVAISAKSQTQTAATTAANNATLEKNAGRSKKIRNEFQMSPSTPSSPSSSSSPNAATATPTSDFQTSLASEIKGLESMLAEYVENFFNKAEYQPKPELIMALQQNYTDMKQKYDNNVRPHMPKVLKKTRPVRQAAVTKRSNGDLSLNIPRAFESGRLLFFAGLKKVMWPIYMGLQILKSLMFALLLPTLIGSFGKLLGKGITSGSAPLFIRPLDEPQDLDFKDNNFNFDDDSNKFSMMNDATAGVDVKDNGYAYNQAEASQTHNQYAYKAASLNQQALSRYGMNERQQLMQDSYLSALQSLGAASFKNSNGLSGSSSGGGGLAAPMRQKPAAPANMNTFQQFQKVPASSLLLSNYDPFYSPLLSRLDSVFAQLKLNSDDEACREKLICLMYANPAKYAPYSNLVSAQLSRELNELRKPTSDNPDILRFFKYMRAAKDGQDGIDCEKSFEKCKEFKDFENPAMVSTYHDINKLVQARKLT